MIRIGFIGCVKFSQDFFIKLIGNKNVVIEWCISKNENNYNSDFVSLKKLSKHYKIPYLSANNINDSNVKEWLINFNVDYIFVFGWSQLLDKSMLGVPSRYCIGFHPASLPFNRGRHPLICAKVLDLKKSSVSFFKLNEKADEGDIIMQNDFAIESNDNASNIYKKSSNIAIELLVELVTRIIQSNHILGTKPNMDGNVWRKRTMEDGRIDFRMHYITIKNLVQALSYPYPGATVRLNNKDFTVWEVVKSNHFLPNHEFGRINLIDKNYVHVRCGDGAIALTSHQLPVDKLKSGDYL